MLLTAKETKALIGKLDKAATDPAARCPTPNVGADGKAYRLEAKPRANKSNLIDLHGAENVVMQNGIAHVKVSLGVHGRAHHAIDPATGKVVCAKCAKG